MLILGRENMEYEDVDGIWQTVVGKEHWTALETVAEPRTQCFQKPLRRVWRLRLGRQPRCCVDSLCCGGLPRVGEERAPPRREIGLRVVDLMLLIQQPKHALTAVGARKVKHRDRLARSLSYFLRFADGKSTIIQTFRPL